MALWLAACDVAVPDEKAKRAARAPQKARPAASGGALELQPSAASVASMGTGYAPDPMTMGIGLPARVPVLRVAVSGRPIEKDVEIPGTLEVFESHDGTLRDLDRQTPSVKVSIALQGRGNSTWGLPKKSYAFEVQDESGNDEDVAILGMPGGSDFALYACYTDKTCLRNAIVYALGQELGRWSPRARFVELILDGEQHGLYMLLERVRRDTQRVDIDKPASSAAEGDISGGYILRAEGKGKDRRDSKREKRDFRVSSGRAYTFHYPKVSKLSAEQRSYITEYMTSFEQALVDAPDAHAEHIDVVSWVDRSIVEEFSQNWDGYVRSVYLTKASKADGGKLAMGPLWDFELTFGNSMNEHGCKTDTWTYQNVHKRREPLPGYWSALLAHPSFQTAWKCRYQRLRRGPLALSTLDTRLETWRRFISDARRRDQQKWHTLGRAIYPNCFSRPTYRGEVEALRDFIGARVAWLDAQAAAMPGTCPSPH